MAASIHGDRHEIEVFGGFRWVYLLCLMPRESTQEAGIDQTWGGLGIYYLGHAQPCYGLSESMAGLLRPWTRTECRHKAGAQAVALKPSRPRRPSSGGGNGNRGKAGGFCELLHSLWHHSGTVSYGVGPWQESWRWMIARRMRLICSEDLSWPVGKSESPWFPALWPTRSLSQCGST